jgi:hypothetical protein
MDEHTPHTPNPAAHAAGHEANDVSISGLAKSLGALVVGGLVVWILLLGLWRYLVARIPYEPTSPFTGMREMPAGPRLQVTPETALQNYFDEEGERLNSYGAAGGVTKEGAATFHIPVDKAMELVAQRGLPTRKQPANKARERNPNEPSAQ